MNGHLHPAETAKMHLEKHAENKGSMLRQLILGGQDGLVNTLGVILAVAAATSDIKIVIIAGMAAAVAESISMAAVGYTSAKAAHDYYKAKRAQEEREVEEIPEVEREEIKLIYYRKGLRGKQLDEIVSGITSDKKLWVDTMMVEEFGLSESEDLNPTSEALWIGLSAFIGSLIPLIPFFLLSVSSAVVAAIGVSVVTLFGVGVLKAKTTEGSWWKGGLEMAAIGMGAAIAGYLIGAALGVTIV